jgi:tetratricopeptide (TPR) repeat protein
MASWATIAYAASRPYLQIGVALAAVCLAFGQAAAQEDEQATPAPAGQSARATAEPPASVDPATLTSALEAAIELDRLMERRRFDSALEMGERMVELTEQDFGRNHSETAKAYARLADAQRRADEHELAEASYHTAIAIYRAIDGPFTPLAVEPLTGLGDNYHEDREYLNAVSSYDEARTVTRRAYGLLADEQTVLLDRMAESLLKLNRIDEADEQQLDALRLVERRSEPGSDARVEAMFKYAAWLRRTYRFQLERLQYLLAMGEIEDRYGKDDVRIVKPLVAIANSFREQGIEDAQGIQALNDALDLLRAELAGDGETPSNLAVAQVFRDIGDWYIAFDRPSDNPRAAAEYRRAWNLLGSLPNGEELRKEWFSGTTYVKRGPLDMARVTATEDADSGSVVVKFDIDVAGVASNAEVIEANPPGLKDADVLRHVIRSRFRPQMADGELVPGRARALRFTYPYSSESTLAQARD